MVAAFIVSMSMRNGLDRPTVLEKRWTCEPHRTPILGDAKKVLLHWEPRAPLDLVFIDADKPGYDTYFEILLPKMKPNGLFIFDNMVWSGRVIEQRY